MDFTGSSMQQCASLIYKVTEHKFPCTQLLLFLSGSELKQKTHTSERFSEQVNYRHSVRPLSLGKSNQTFTAKQRVHTGMSQMQKAPNLKEKYSGGIMLISVYPVTNKNNKKDGGARYLLDSFSSPPDLQSKPKPG